MVAPGKRAKRDVYRCLSEPFSHQSLKVLQGDAIRAFPRAEPAAKAEAGRGAAQEVGLCDMMLVCSLPKGFAAKSRRNCSVNSEHQECPAAASTKRLANRPCPNSECRVCVFLVCCWVGWRADADRLRHAWERAQPRRIRSSSDFFFSQRVLEASGSHEKNPAGSSGGEMLPAGLGKCSVILDQSGHKHPPTRRSLPSMHRPPSAYCTFRFPYKPYIQPQPQPVFRCPLSKPQTRVYPQHIHTHTHTLIPSRESFPHACTLRSDILLCSFDP